MESAAILSGVLAFVFAIAANVIFFEIELQAGRAGFRTQIMKSIPYALRLFSFYRQMAAENGWSKSYVTAHWVSVAGMFVFGILAFVFFEYSEARNR